MIGLEISPKPKSIMVVFACLDRILDYLPLEDLSRMTAVNKFFCYTATLERLYIKFEIEETESFIESSLGDLARIIANTID